MYRIFSITRWRRFFQIWPCGPSIFSFILLSQFNHSSFEIGKNWSIQDDLLVLRPTLSSQCFSKKGSTIMPESLPFIVCETLFITVTLRQVLLFEHLLRKQHQVLTHYKGVVSNICLLVGRPQINTGTLITCRRRLI